MREHVYVAGPMSKGDQFLNVVTACKAAEEVRRQGFVPFIPQLYQFWHMVDPVRSYEDYMDMDFAWITRCNALLRLPGESTGADREVAFAQANDVPVFYSLEDLVAYFRNPSELKVWP